jgi:hypothetical protein
MSKKTWWWVGALAAMAACSGGSGASSSSPSATPAGVPWITDRARGGDETERAVAQRATGAQAGTVREVRKDYLVLDPYESWAGDARIRIQDATLLFRGDDRISEDVTDVVRPGQDVNVYYGEQEGVPIAMGIKLLSAEEAAQLRNAISSRKGPSGSGTTASGDRPAPGPSAAPSAFGASQSQAGRIASLTGDEIELDPYHEAAGEARLRMDPGVPVMRNGERVGREALRRGEDVRVYFEGGDSRGSVSGDKGGSVSGDKDGSVSGDKGGSVSGDKGGSVSGDKSGSVGGGGGILDDEDSVSSKAGSGDELRVVAIEILSDEEARRIRDSER